MSRADKIADQLRAGGIKVDADSKPSFGAAAQLRMLGDDEGANREWAAALKEFVRENPDQEPPKRPWGDESSF